MKRLVSVFAIASVASAALAQSFTIISPRDGQKLREVVEMTFPKGVGDIEPGSFIGISLNGKFLEAVVPDVDQQRGVLTYKLDTKAMRLPDGEHTLGAALYRKTPNGTMITERSEVRITLANYDIPVPAEGILLRYNWKPATQNYYAISFLQDVSMMTGAQNRMGGRAARQPIFEERARYLIAVDDVKSGGTGVVRIQLVPYKGENKDYLYITRPGATGPAVINKWEFGSLVRLISNRGHEQYADVPDYHGFFGINQRKMDKMLMINIPMPLLPEQPQKVGDRWTGRIVISEGEIPEIQATGRAAIEIPAQATLESIEWEQGRRTAKIRLVTERAADRGGVPTVQVGTRDFRNDNRLSISEVLWFDIDRGEMVKRILTVEGDRRIEPATTSQGAGAGGAQGGPSAAGATASGGGGGTAGQAGVDRGLQRGGPQGPGGQGGPTFGGANAPGQRGGQGGGQQGGDAALFVRERLVITITLDN